MLCLRLREVSRIESLHGAMRFHAYGGMETAFDNSMGAILFMHTNVDKRRHRFRHPHYIVPKIHPGRIKLLANCYYLPEGQL